MTITDWALNLGALLLAGYAGWVLLADPHRERGGRGTPGGKGGPAGQRALGCGFGLVALTVWSFSFSNLLDSWTDGARLAAGLLLALTAAACLLRRQVLRAIPAALVAVLLAGPLLPGLWSRVAPTDSQAVVREMQAEVSALETRLADLAALEEQLAEDAAALRARVRDAGHDDYATLAADAEARGALRELAEVERLLARTAGERQRTETALEANRDLLRRLSRHIAAEEALGHEVTRAHLEEMARGVQRAVEPAPGEQTLDDVVEEQRLKELFERTR